MPVPLNFDLIKEIVKAGLTTPEGEHVDPSLHPQLKSAGLATVTAYVEQLSMIDIITDPEPLFGRNGGRWIGYMLTGKGRQLAGSERDLRIAVAELTGGPKTEVTESVRMLLDECRLGGINEHYREDFLQTLNEIGTCFDHGCFIATIVLCGKILEVCIKEILIRNHVGFDPNQMAGTLLKLMRERVPGEYIDPSLGNVLQIINTSRNTAVHANERIPVPSRDQAIMVIFAMRDVVRRNLSHTQTG